MDGTVLGNFRNVTFTSVCGVTNADIECALLTQASANLDNSVIRTTSATSVACLQDPTFGTSTDLHDVEFIQAGAGHAIELSTAGTYTLTNVSFTGYGADASESAALDITAGTGTYNINYTGTAPTFKKSGTETVNLISTVPVTVTVVDKNNKPIDNVQTAVYLSSDDTEVINEDTHVITAGSFVTGTKYTIVTVGTTDFTAIGAASNTVGVAFTATGAGSGTGTATDGVADGTLDSTLAPADCYIRCRKNTTTETRYFPFSTSGTIASGTGLNATVVLQRDNIAST